MNAAMMPGTVAEVIATSGKPRVVILGGGFGGLAAAVSLAGVDADVILVDRRNHHFF